MSRFARTHRVFFFEEPVFEDTEPYLRSVVCPKTGVRVQTPVLPHGLDQQAIRAQQKRLLGSMLEDNQINRYVAWYYTPMAKEFAGALRPKVTVYDCMDELSCFAGASPAMRANELALFEEAELVFTGGASLYESKRKQHHAVYLFPSSVDVAHFARARTATQEPADQSSLPKPRFGYAGVIDERMDLELIWAVAEQRPNWQLVLLGPVVKIDPSALPQAPNIHYLGMKQYTDLPSYLSGWQIGMLPFALNESTRFISPTKTPEYLAAGLQVISTPIRDVVTPYGVRQLVGIAHDAAEFIHIGDELLSNSPDDQFLARVDEFLSQSSWDRTWSDMNKLVSAALTSAGSEAMHLTSTISGGVAHV